MAQASRSREKKLLVFNLGLHLASSNFNFKMLGSCRCSNTEHKLINLFSLISHLEREQEKGKMKLSNSVKVDRSEAIAMLIILYISSCISKCNITSTRAELTEVFKAVTYGNYIILQGRFWQEIFCRTKQN